MFCINTGVEESLLYGGIDSNNSSTQSSIVSFLTGFIQERWIGYPARETKHEAKEKGTDKNMLAHAGRVGPGPGGGIPAVGAPYGL